MGTFSIKNIDIHIARMLYSDFSRSFETSVIPVGVNS